MLGKILKKVSCIVVALAMMTALAACTNTSTSSSTDQGGTVELSVFAAASMTETITEIADLYKTVAPDVKITLNFDSSGTLKTQIQEGAQCDLFISAAQKQMNELDSSKGIADNPEQLDFVEQGTRVDILENTVTLVVPKDNPKDVASFDDMAQKLKDGEILMAMGNSDVPVGQYTQKILTYLELDEAALAKAGAITYGSNVKEVTTQVSEGSVDCGVVYSTDAYSAGLTVVATATPEMCGRAIYPAAVMKDSKNKEAAKAFIDYLQTDECMKVFEKVGFSAVS